MQKHVIMFATEI